jgi:hypothetical protein
MFGRVFGLRRAEASGFGNITPHKVSDVQYDDNQELTGANASITDFLLVKQFCALILTQFLFELNGLAIYMVNELPVLPSNTIAASPPVWL